MISRYSVLSIDIRALCAIPGTLGAHSWKSSVAYAGVTDGTSTFRSSLFLCFVSCI